MLAVPHTLDSGAPFPDRDLIVVITCGVIVLTLLQALLLPAVVRFARLPVDTSVSEELHLAEVFTLDSAIESLDATAAELGTGEMVVERVRHELDKQRKLLAAAGADGDPVVLHDDQYTSLSLALIARRREALLELRDQRQIDDIVLRRVQARLDIEEVRFSRANPRGVSRRRSSARLHRTDRVAVREPPRAVLDPVLAAGQLLGEPRERVPRDAVVLDERRDDEPLARGGR